MNAEEKRSPIKALVIEDEWIVAVDVQRTLRRAGYQVDEVITDGNRAIAAFDRIRPDVVLLDIELGLRFDGIALAERLRAKSAVRIVFLSAHSDLATLRRAMKADPQGFVVKPFTEAQLLTALELALRNLDEPSEPRLAAQQTLERIAAVLAESGHRIVAAEPTLDHVPELSGLSSREKEILKRLVAHQRVPTIAKSLGISENTVRNHLKSMFAKTSVHSQEELLELVVRAGGLR